MIRLAGLVAICGIMAQAGLAGLVRAEDFQDDLERDFSLRTIGQLQVTNLRGAIVIHGWSQEKIRVRAHRRVQAASLAESKKALAALDFRYRSIEGDIELSAEYGKGMEIQARLKERLHPQTGMDMEVWAPANLKLQVWAAEGAVAINAWEASVEVRTKSGPITVMQLKSDGSSLLCPECAIKAEDVKGSLRCMAGKGSVNLHKINGKSIYSETSSGSQTLSEISGEQLYVSKEGAISGDRLEGQIEFHSGDGSFELVRGIGFVSGRTERGRITIKMREWKFTDKALLESVKGDIRLELPARFAGEVDLWSVYGKVDNAFMLQPLIESRVYGPEPASHVRGRVGSGGDQLKVFSLEGAIQLSRGESLD